MAIRPIIKSTNSLKKDIKERLSNRAGITHWSNDGVAKSLVDAIAVEQRLLSNRMNSALRNMQVSTAEGSNLDNLGVTRGVQRLKANTAESMKREMNFYFYSDTTFGDLNGGADILIPKGTLVAPGAGLTPGDQVATQSDIIYATAVDYTLPASASIYYCSIKAQTPGKQQNVGSNVLISHSFTNYTTFGTSNLKCSNNYSILNGSDSETDDLYRFRVSSHYAALAGATQDALILRSLEVPGVLEIRTVPNYFGIGTAAVFVFGVDGESNSNLVTRVQQRINSLQTAGLKIIASPGIKISFDFDLLFYTKESLNDRDQALIKRGLRTAIQEYFATNGAGPDRIVNLNTVRQRIKNVPIVQQRCVDRGSTTELFNNVYVRKNYSTTRSASERVTLDSIVYSLEPFEYADLGSLTIRFQKTDLAI